MERNCIMRQVSPVFRRLWPVLLAALLAALLLGGCASSSPEATPAPSAAPLAPASPAPTEAAPPEQASVQDQYLTDPIPEGRPAPAEPQDQEITEEELHCTISISCATILENMDACKKDKRELVPEDGWILEPTEVVFYRGESVFNVLQRTCRQKKIHMEFSTTPIYNSAFIEGIHNLYEFDVGELSGWMYSVNGWFPNYGCSRYALQDGDVVEWVYTCDLGADVGDNSMIQAEG